MTILIDGNNLLHRELNSENFGGVHPVRSLYNDLLLKDDLVVWVWDGYKGNDRRKEIYPEYKGNREGSTGEDIYAMFKLVQELLSQTSVMQIKVPTWEADDVIYTLAKFFASSGDTVRILTNDADYLQMADLPGISLPQVTKWSWDSSLIVTYKAMVGDKSDNIPGMPRFGEGAWGHCRTYHETMRECLRDNNWELWQTLAFPKLNQKHCLDKGNFDQCVTFFKLISMQDVPLEDITKNQTLGVRNDSAAEAILAQYHI